MTDILQRRARIGFAALAAAACLAAPQAALAESDIVNAVATFERAITPITVAGVDALDLGTIRIPSGETEGARCVYSLESDGGAVAVTEIDADGDPVAGAAPTASGCEQSGTAAPGKFDLSCAAAENVTLSASWTTAVSGVTLRSPVSGDMISFAPLGEPISNSATGSSLTVACPAGGKAEIQVGGAMVVETLAVEATNLTVGVVTLSANY